MRLTDQDFAKSHRYGDKRIANCDRKGIGDAAWRGTPDLDNQTMNSDGILAEIAVSRFLGKTWVAFSATFRDVAADVGRNVQARSTRYATGGLLCHAHDREHLLQPFVCVRLHRLPMAELVGWAYGHEVLIPEYRQRNHRGIYWLMPAKRLRPMSDLHAVAL